MIEHIASFTIPPKALEHRFVRGMHRQLSALNPDDIPVFGTANRRTAELYGWQGSVASHVDNKGLVYLLLLDSPVTQISCGEVSVVARSGMILCLNDRLPHHTVQPAGSNSIALFTGAFSQRCDEEAIAQLCEALSLLSRGIYIDGLRSSKLPPERDECYCIPGGELHITTNPMAIRLISDATRDGDHVIRCAHANCEEPAVIVDAYYPYYQNLNTCLEHRRT